MHDKVLAAEQAAQLNEPYQDLRDAMSEHNEDQPDRSQETPTPAKIDQMTTENRDPKGEELRHDIKEEPFPGETHTEVFAENGTSGEEQDVQKEQLQKIRTKLEEFALELRTFTGIVKTDLDSFVTGNFLRDEDEIEKIINTAQRLEDLIAIENPDALNNEFKVINEKMNQYMDIFNQRLKNWDSYFGDWKDQENCARQWGRILQIKNSLEELQGMMRSLAAQAA